MIFKCALAIWLRSLTVEISDVPCTGEVVSLLPRKLETINFWTFLEYIVVKSFDNYTFLERTLNLQCEKKFYS